MSDPQLCEHHVTVVAACTRLAHVDDETAHRLAADLAAACPACLTIIATDLAGACPACISLKEETP